MGSCHQGSQEPRQDPDSNHCCSCAVAAFQVHPTPYSNYLLVSCVLAPLGPCLPQGKLMYCPTGRVGTCSLGDPDRCAIIQEFRDAKRKQSLPGFSVTLRVQGHVPLFRRKLHSLAARSHPGLSTHLGQGPVYNALGQLQQRLGFHGDLCKGKGNMSLGSGALVGGAVPLSSW